MRLTDRALMVRLSIDKLGGGEFEFPFYRSCELEMGLRLLLRLRPKSVYGDTQVTTGLVVNIQAIGHAEYPYPISSLAKVCLASLSMRFA